MDKRILISIVTIDRDAHLIPRLYASIQHYLSKRNINLLVVCRESDINCQREWKIPKTVIKTVPHYEILARHNLDKISEQRNICMNYARKHKYDYLLFLDSDIIIQSNTLEILLEGCEKYGADICVVPYFIKGLGYNAIGKFTSSGMIKLKEIKNTETAIKYKKGAGGMGCTLIKKSLFHIPFKVSIIETTDNWKILSEDVGFYLQLREYDCKYVKNHIIEHL